jgi:hypothetical protein
MWARIERFRAIYALSQRAGQKRMTGLRDAFRSLFRSFTIQDWFLADFFGFVAVFFFFAARCCGGLFSYFIDASCGWRATYACKEK